MQKQESKTTKVISESGLVKVNHYGTFLGSSKGPSNHLMGRLRALFEQNSLDQEKNLERRQILQFLQQSLSETQFSNNIHEEELTQEDQ